MAAVSPMEVVMRRAVSVLWTVMLLSSCSEPLTPEAAAAGTYSLATVRGAAVPTMRFESPTERIDVVGGSLVLRRDGSVTEVIELRSTVSGDRQERREGTFTVSGQDLRLYWSTYAMSASIRDGVVAYDIYTFVKD